MKTRLFTALLFIIYCGNVFSDTNTEKSQYVDSIESDYTMNEYRIFDKTFIKEKDKFLWECQLNGIKEMSDSILQPSDIKLTGYTFNKEINNAQEFENIQIEMTHMPILVKNSMDIYYVMEPDSASFLEFRIALKFLMPATEGEYLLVNYMLPYDGFKSTYQFKSRDLSEITLHWLVKGKKIDTKCLVSKEKGIIYDNFLYFIASPTESELLRFISIQQPKTQQLDKEQNKYSFQRKESVYNIIGMEVCRSSVTYTVVNKKDRGLENYSVGTNNSSCAPGWYSNISSSSSSVKLNGKLHFKWKYGYGPNFSFVRKVSGESEALKSGDDYIGYSDLK